jgi:SseB protein N-terminal domain
MNHTQAEVVEAAKSFRAGTLSGDELSDAFGAATLYCFLADEPGFMAVGEPGAGFIPMYSSEEALTAAEGSTAWFAAKGLDLLQLVPEGYGVVLDPGTDGEICLAPWAIRRESRAPAGAEA